VSAALVQALPTFAPAFATALLTNLSIAAHALAIGLPLGLLLGLLRLPATDPCAARVGQRLGVHMADLAVALLRAAPAFVVMYVLLHALPARWAVAPQGAVALALAAYATAYVADTLLATLVDRREGARGGGLLFVLGLARAYFVMVLSSGFGVAIGVTEATAVTLRMLEQLPATADRLWLMGGVVLVFITLRQSVYAAIFVVRRTVQRRPPR
jgi:hypothetical protein